MARVRRGGGPGVINKPGRLAAFSLVRRWLPVLLWMGVIFWISSSEDPYRATAAWLGLGWGAALGEEFRLVPLVSNETLGQIAHFGEFWVLGLLAGRAAGVSGRQEGRAWVGAFLLCAVYALSDEVHQALVPERAFQALDLGIDWGASFLGLAAARRWVFPRRGERDDKTKGSEKVEIVENVIKFQGRWGKQETAKPWFTMRR